MKWLRFIFLTVFVVQSLSFKGYSKDFPSDSTEINKLLDLSKYYYVEKSDLDSMYHFALKANRIAKSNRSVYLLSKSFEYLGTSKLLKNELDSSYVYYRHALDLAMKLNHDELKFPALIGLSRYYEKSNNLAEAMVYGLKSVQIAESMNKRDLLASAYYKLANIYALHDDEKKHKIYLDKAFKIIDKNDSIPVNIKSGIYTSLVDYFEQKRYKNPNDKTLIDSILFYADKGIAYTKSVNSASSLVYLLGIKGKMFFVEDDINKAKAFYDEALTYKDIISRTSLYGLYNKLAYVSIKAKKIEEALRYKDSILKDIEDEPSYYRKAERYNVAYNICKTGNRYKLALKYHENMTDNFNKAKDEIQIKTLNELDIKYQTQKKDAEISKQKLQNATLKNKARTNYFIISTLALLGIGILGFLYFKKKNKALASELKLENTKAALHRSQLNPHFISNSINAIYPFLYDKSDPNKAAAYLSDLSQMIRSILDSTFESDWTIKEELEFITRYCKIQDLKMDSPFELQIDCHKTLFEVRIPSLITQTFIENAFVHGFNEQMSKAIINIEITKNDNGILIQISDNGKAQIHKVSSFESRSTTIVKERIRNSYPKKELTKDFLICEKLATGYKVFLKLPDTK